MRTLVLIQMLLIVIACVADEVAAPATAVDSMASTPQAAAVASSQAPQP